MKTQIYLVEFIKYVNVEKNCVYSAKHNKYLNINKNGFLVRKEHLKFLEDYGDGIKTAKLIGELFEIPNTNYSEFLRD